MRRRIKIINKTDYQTKQLKAFISRIVREFWENDDRNLRITFYYAKDMGQGHDHSWCRGWAYLNSGTSQIGLPRGGNVDKVDMVHTIVHEFGHNKGLNHVDMRGSPKYMRCGNWREMYAWADSLPLEMKPPKIKNRPDATDIADQKAIKAEQRITEIDRKVKRLTTLRKKWTRKLTYYNRRKGILAAKKLEN